MSSIRDMRINIFMLDSLIPMFDLDLFMNPYYNFELSEFASEISGLRYAVIVSDEFFGNIDFPMAITLNDFIVVNSSLISSEAAHGIISHEVAHYAHFDRELARIRAVPGQTIVMDRNSYEVEADEWSIMTVHSGETLAAFLGGVARDIFSDPSFLGSKETIRLRRRQWRSRLNMLDINIRRHAA